MVHRRYNEIADVIKKNLRNLSEEEQKNVITSALKASNSYHHTQSSLQSNPKGIQRLSDDSINKVWQFWDFNSTLSNAKTERPSTISVRALNKNPLLSRVNIDKYDIVKVTNKRNVEMLSHQDRVQNETDLDLF